MENIKTKNYYVDCSLTTLGPRLFAWNFRTVQTCINSSWGNNIFIKIDISSFNTKILSLLA